MDQYRDQDYYVNTHKGVIYRYPAGSKDPFSQHSYYEGTLIDPYQDIHSSPHHTKHRNKKKNKIEYNYHSSPASGHWWGDGREYGYNTGNGYNVNNMEGYNVNNMDGYNGNNMDGYMAEGRQGATCVCGGQPEYESWDEAGLAVGLILLGAVATYIMYQNIVTNIMGGKRSGVGIGIGNFILEGKLNIKERTGSRNCNKWCFYRVD